MVAEAARKLAPLDRISASRMTEGPAGAQAGPPASGRAMLRPSRVIARLDHTNGHRFVRGAVPPLATPAAAPHRQERPHHD